MITLYCTFNKSVGWRVKGSTEDYTDTTIQVVQYKGQKCLSIPSDVALRAGYFCNPRKIALTFVRNCLHYVESLRHAQGPFWLHVENKNNRHHSYHTLH